MVALLQPRIRHPVSLERTRDGVVRLPAVLVLIRLMLRSGIVPVAHKPTRPENERVASSCNNQTPRRPDQGLRELSVLGMRRRQVCLQPAKIRLDVGRSFDDLHWATSEDAMGIVPPSIQHLP